MSVPILICVGTEMLWRSGWGEKQHLLDVLDVLLGPLTDARQPAGHSRPGLAMWAFNKS